MNELTNIIKIMESNTLMLEKLEKKRLELTAQTALLLSDVTDLKARTKKLENDIAVKP